MAPPYEKLHAWRECHELALGVYKEFRRFLDISLSSLTEVGYALRFAKEAGLLEEGVWRDLNDRQNRARFLHQPSTVLHHHLTNRVPTGIWSRIQVGHGGKAYNGLQRQVECSSLGCFL